MASTTRMRPIPHHVGGKSTLKEWRQDYDGSIYNVKNYESDLSDTLSSLTGIQITESSNHPGWKSLQGGFRGDKGGDFRTSKSYVEVLSAPQVKLSGVQMLIWQTTWAHGEYHGPMLPLSPPELQFPPSSESSKDDLEEKGTTAIARCSPVNPSVDLTTALGELLHEGLPKLSGALLSNWRALTNRQRRKAIADEYLNQEFGWKPLVNDIRNLAGAIVNMDARLAQLERDAGKMVRRRYRFSPEATSETVQVAQRLGPWIGPPDSSVLFKESGLVYGKVFRTHEVTKEQWFSGAFTYALPLDSSIRGRMARYVELAKGTFGLSLTPDSIWNLAPWSWAIDWVTNAGDVLKNLDAVILFNQVLLYGYIMEHTVSRYTYTYVGPSVYQTEHIPPSVSLVTETKVRYRATPYGFGINWDGLNSTQRAILGALGISRSHR